MNQPEPTFSVVVPSYNYAHFLADALDSVIAQNRSDVQVVVIDDASEDETAQVVEPYLDRVEYHRNPVNLGAGGAWREGLARASGRYVIKLDADDQLTPGCLDAAGDAFASDDQLGIVISSVWVLDEKSGRITLKRVTDRNRTLSAEEFRHRLLGGFFFKMPACVLKRELAEAIDPPDEALYQLHDWEFILRATRGRKAVLLSEPGAIYRVHDRSISATARAGNRLYQDIQRWIAAASKPGGQQLTPPELKRLKGSCGELMLTGFVPRPNLGSWREYLRNYGRALRISSGGGIAQVLRMHGSLLRKALKALLSSPETRPVVRQV